MKVYIVMGHAPCEEQDYNYILKVYTVEELAERHCELANAFHNEMDEKVDKLRAEDFDLERVQHAHYSDPRRVAIEEKLKEIKKLNNPWDDIKIDQCDWPAYLRYYTTESWEVSVAIQIYPLEGATNV